VTQFAPRDKVVAAIRTHYAADFAHHERVTQKLRPVVLHTRQVHTPVETALDFMLIQAYKAHEAVAVLLENGLAEDGATVTRRLLEIGVQAIYIGADSEAEERERRAGRYLAYLWREMPQPAKEHLKGPVADHWAGIAAKYGAEIPAKATRWGPSFAVMFRYAEREDTYKEDYSLLSRIAHGSPEEFIMQYSAEKVRLRFSLHTPSLIRVASRYYAGTVSVWNRHFGALNDDEMADLMRLAMEDEDDAPAT
jgi:hypothetical protein